MMTGVIVHEGVRYCIIPDVRATEGFYWDGGPSLRSPLDKDGNLVDPAGRRVTSAVPVLEKDLWTASNKLVTLQDWPVYPFSSRIFELPPAVVDRIIMQTTVTPTKGTPNSRAKVGWEGIILNRDFVVAQLGVGLEVWPPRVIPEWTQFFFLFAPGTQKLFEQGTVFFDDREPIVYGYKEGSSRPTVVQGDTRLIQGRKGAFCRIMTAPRWIVFRARNGDDTHGILPFQIGDNGELRIPRAGDRRKSAFAHRVEPRELDSTQPPIALAVDFGTSNTAVAVGAGAGEMPVLLRFTEESRAVNLTAMAQLDPSSGGEFKYRFFPLTNEYSNPLPTILLQFDEPGGPFADSSLFPKRAIPGVNFSSSAIQQFARGRNLKQDFKWKDRGEGPEHRRAYLEHLALIVGWELRTQHATRARASVDTLFTCPLAFSEDQTENLSRTVSAFRETLESCGLRPKAMGSLMSESLANLHYVKRMKTQGANVEGERHVVVDIGGGTTDIAVFSGTGEPLLLDSLYIGGKDVAEHLLAFRITEQNRWQPVAKVLGLQENAAPTGPGDTHWTEMAQCLLISRMAADDGRGLGRLAADFDEQKMRDLLGEIATLLVFVTLYAIRMAVLARSGDGIPKATDVWVWYAGLGSRLFDLAPLGRGMMDRRKTAVQMLREAVKELPDLKNVDVQFDWTYGKESVCRGTLFACDARENDSARDEKPLDLKTVWWADVPRQKGAIAWSDLYDARTINEFTENDRLSAKIDELVRCFEAAVSVVGRTTFGSGWAADEARLKKMRSTVVKDFARACGDIKNSKKQAPKHPVRYVTDRIKKSEVCELVE